MVDQLSDPSRDDRFRRAYEHLGFTVLGPSLEFMVNGNVPPSMRRITVGQTYTFVWHQSSRRTGVLVAIYRIGHANFGIVRHHNGRTEGEYRVPVADLEE